MVRLLEEQGEHDIVLRYVEAQRLCLVPGPESYFNEQTDLLFDKLSDPAVAAEQFEREWSYVKTLLRALAAGKKAGEYSRDIANGCCSGKIKIDAGDGSWDLFLPENNPGEMHVRGWSDGKLETDGVYLSKFMTFIRSGLSDKRFVVRAIECIHEMGDSPMKLMLLEEAAGFLPDTWDAAQREAFFSTWLATIEVCGRQIAAQDFLEPDPDFPLLRDPRRRRLEEAEKFEHLLPKQFTDGSYYRERMASALDWRMAEDVSGRLPSAGEAAKLAAELFPPAAVRLCSVCGASGRNIAG